uniref:Uncharacterized protein n=1 Tax=Arundo donax TaxID=35708 RepID=A0A0A8YBI3_ARUDO
MEATAAAAVARPPECASTGGLLTGNGSSPHFYRFFVLLLKLPCTP